MTSRDSVPPRANPGPDNQYDLKLCSGFALGKAIISGYMKGRFVKGKVIDISQESVVTALVNEYKVHKFSI